MVKEFLLLLLAVGCCVIVVTRLFADLVHAVLERLLVEAKCLLGQLKPDSDHMAHVHEALVQVAKLEL